MSIRYRAFLTLLCCALWGAPALAQDPPRGDPAAMPPAVKSYQKKTGTLYDRLKEVAENLSPAEKKHFYLIYNNYNLIGAVKMVEGDVGAAVKACGKANPDIAEKLDKRYAAWKGAIDPVIGEAEDNLNNMVIAQDYTPKAKIKSLFKAADDTRKATNDKIDKVPVTSPDACNYLHDKMDDTQKDLTRMLRETLISIPQSVPAPLEATDSSDKE